MVDGGNFEDLHKSIFVEDRLKYNYDFETVSAILDRSKLKSYKFNDRELNVFFHATPEAIRKLRERDGEFKKDAGKIFSKRGQAQQFIIHQPIFYDRSGMWWMWSINKKCWELVDEVDILNMIQDSNGADIITSKSRTEIINSLKQEGRKNIPKTIKKTWVQFKDRIYDIENGDYIQATPEYFVTNPIPYEVSGDPSTPKIDKIFKEWVGSEYVDTLHEIIAYSVLPDYPIHRLFCFLGSGLNGKSCFLRLLKNFLGDKNVTSTELDILMSSRFEVTRLHKKLVCMMGETNFSEMSKTSIIKKLTGQDVIGFEYKNKKPFEDVNYAKILIATNNLPATSDKTIGFYRRWSIIDFPNQFDEKKDVLAEIPEEEYNNLATRCITVLNKLLIKKSFHNEGTIEERMQKYEKKSNPFENFWKENVEEDYGGSIWKHEFRDRIKDWCKEHKFRELSDVIISKSMKNKGIEDGRKQAEWFNKEGNKPIWRCWKGVKWKN